MRTTGLGDVWGGQGWKWELDDQKMTLLTEDVRMVEAKVECPQFTENP